MNAAKSVLTRRLLISLIATGSMLAVMVATDSPLKTEDTPLGILHLEFAYNVKELTSILKIWKAQFHEEVGLIYFAKLNTYLDFLFLTCYGYLFFSTCQFIALKISNKFGKLGNLMAKLAVSAAIFDIVENVLMLAAMDSIYNRITLLAMAGAAGIKWMIVILTIAYILAGIALLIRNLLIRSV